MSSGKLSSGLSGIMQRTHSLDYRIVPEGSMEMVLNSRGTRVLNMADIAEQRATMHTLGNPSWSKWARMVFVLQECQPLHVGGKELGEDLGACEEIPQSG